MSTYKDLSKKKGLKYESEFNALNDRGESVRIRKPVRKGLLADPRQPRRKAGRGRTEQQYNESNTDSAKTRDGDRDAAMKYIKEYKQQHSDSRLPMAIDEAVLSTNRETNHHGEHVHFVTQARPLFSYDEKSGKVNHSNDLEHPKGKCKYGQYYDKEEKRWRCIRNLDHHMHAGAQGGSKDGHKRQRKGEDDSGLPDIFYDDSEPSPPTPKDKTPKDKTPKRNEVDNLLFAPDTPATPKIKENPIVSNKRTFSKSQLLNMKPTKAATPSGFHKEEWNDFALPGEEFPDYVPPKKNLFAAAKKTLEEDLESKSLEQLTREYKKDYGDRAMNILMNQIVSGKFKK